MTSATYPKGNLALALLAGVAGIGAGLFAARSIRRRGLAAEAPAAAFAGQGAHPDSPVHTRDAGPEHIRDEDGHDWDAIDQASDESFPSSDPPVANNFSTPEPIDYPENGRPH